jgi:predicted dehydrogenase
VRVVFLGVGHWHFRIYAAALANEPGVEVVGISDPDARIAEAAAAQMGCAAFTDYRKMCETLKPDFAFAIGRHAAMAAEGDYLIDAGIPFSLEKPCGVTYAEVKAIADKAARKGAFAASTFGFRYS